MVRLLHLGRRSQWWCSRCDFFCTKTLVMARFSRVLHRVELQGGQRNSVYIYRDPQKGGKWHLYFLNRETNRNHRFVLKRSDGGYPDSSSAGENEAQGLAQERYIDFRIRTDRGEAIKVLTLGEMVRRSEERREANQQQSLQRHHPCTIPTNP